MKMLDERQSVAGCESGCSRCAAQPIVAVRAAEFSLAGGRMVVASAGFFLGPILLAIAGAVVFGPNGAGQLFAGVGGLATGMVASVVAARFLVRSVKENG